MSQVIIHPYYTGRDKGPLVEFYDRAPSFIPQPPNAGNCFVPTFPSVEAAKQYLRERGDAEWQIEGNYRYPLDPREGQ